MANKIDQMLDSTPKRKRGRPRTNFTVRVPIVRTHRGELHALLSRGLPDLCRDGICQVGMLAKTLDLRTQTIYKWMRSDRKQQIPKNQIERIIALSHRQTGGDFDFVPLTIQDLWPFVTTFEKHKGTARKHP